MSHLRFGSTCLLLLALLLGLSSCGGGTTERPEVEPYIGILPDDTPSTPRPPSTPPPAPPAPTPTPPGTVTSAPRIPRSATPPFGVTWHIGYTENASSQKLQDIYGQIVSLNTALWNVTEGQAYIYKVVIRDNVGPGTTPSGWQINHSVVPSSDLDVVVWPNAAWDLSGTAGLVSWSLTGQYGRTGLLMLMPDTANSHTWLHETGHLVWDLSWPNWCALDDEYVDGVQDPACVMESTNPPRRWCSDSNHVAQSSQPHACWHQILLDYANFTHQDKDTATAPAWVPLVSYQDTP